jgi:hypothetical protein
MDTLQQREQRKYQEKRDQIARKAADSQERSRREYEERMLNKRAALDAQARKEEQQFRMGLSDKEFKQQSMREAAAAQREMNDPYRKQMIAESQARIGQMNQPAMSGMGGGLAQPSVTSAQISRLLSNPLVKNAKSAQEQYEAAMSIDPVAAAAAFPGVAGQRQQAAGNLAQFQSLLDNATDRAKSYLNF